MRRIVIICSGGFSSSLIARKINEKFRKNKINYFVESTYIGKKIELLKQNKPNLYLLSPQIKIYRDNIISDYNISEDLITDIPEKYYIPTDEAINYLVKLIENNIKEKNNKKIIKEGKMNILLVCAGGFSTSILVNKVKKWAEENGENIHIEATGKEAYISMWENFDCILVGPQISYAIDEIKANVAIPVSGIEPMVYALGEADKLVALAKKITNKEE